MADFAGLRARMVAEQIAARGIWDERLLTALRAVPRERFVPARLAALAYEDRPLPIGAGQTISQPWVVARTLDALDLEPGDRVLEIGTGSGYAAAVLSRIVREVYTVERIAALADAARLTLAGLGYDNVEVRCGDGTLGWREHAPYDAIAVSAGAPALPPALLAQLAVGGRMVLPIGADPCEQLLMRVTRHARDAYSREPLDPVRFVPLVGAQGWREPELGDGESDRESDGESDAAPGVV